MASPRDAQPHWISRTSSLRSGESLDAIVPNEAVADLHKALLKEHGFGFRAVPKASTEPSLRKELTDLASEAAAELKTPGGFRRSFLHRQAEASGVPMELRPTHWNKPLMTKLRPLVRVGYFESILGISEEGIMADELQVGEAGITSTIFAIIKGFIGTGITVMSAAFAKGGWAEAATMLIFIGLLNGLCIHLLLQCSDRTRCTLYGGVARAATGRVGELVVQLSLVASQFANGIAFMIFISKNAVPLGMGTPASIIWAQVVVLAPICLIRSLDKLEGVILIADAFILGGIAVIFAFLLSIFATRGISPSVQLYDFDNAGIFFGTAMFSFEGIPSILPIRQAMREPSQFHGVFYKTFFPVVALYVAIGLLGYASWGEHVQAPILLDLPMNAWGIGVKLAYMLALLLSIPFFFIPVARITELWLFGVTQKGVKKWRKNGFRIVEIALLGLVAVKGEQEFEKFLVVVGIVCAVPLAFIYPALFHLILCANDAGSKAFDIAVILFGCIAAVYVLVACSAGR